MVAKRLGGAIRALLARARGRRRDPTEPTEAFEGALKELLDDLVDRVEQDTGQGPPGVWIFRPRVDVPTYLRAILDLVDTELDRARYEAWAASCDPNADPQCGCRCRAHRRVACPICLDVHRCPAHSDPDPATLELDEA